MKYYYILPLTTIATARLPTLLHPQTVPESTASLLQVWHEECLLPRPNACWQILQAVLLPDGCLAINCNNVFGGGASGRCWWSVMCLILWRVLHHYGCHLLLDYEDDVFSHDFADAMVLYPHYHTLMPQNQCQLLACFNNLAMPHDQPKQMHGVSLPVIRMQVGAAAPLQCCLTPRNA